MPCPAMAVTPEHIQPLLDVTRSLVDLGGKRWRPLFLVLCARAMTDDPAKAEASEKTAYGLAPLVEFVHTASLIHDDIEDNSDMRRGKPAAYITYGMDTAINAGSWLYFQAPVTINRLDCSDALKLRLYQAYTMELRKLHLGQAMDIAWHRQKSFIPTAEEYLAMVKNKTGTLAALAATLGILAANGSDSDCEKAAEAAREIGAGFQIIDDVINIKIGNPGKKRGDDIVEGKKSLPVILFAQNQDPEKTRLLMEYFVQAEKEGIESSAVEKAVCLLLESGDVEKACAMGIQFINSACSKFDLLFGKDKAESKLIRELFLSMVPENLRTEKPAPNAAINMEKTNA